MNMEIQDCRRRFAEELVRIVDFEHMLSGPGCMMRLGDSIVPVGRREFFERVRG